MRFEWDESKRLSNIEKHCLDFYDADLLFNGSIYKAQAKTVQGEVRRQVTGMIYDVVVTAIFTMRDDTVRLISLRRANREEQRHYFQLFE